MTDGEPARTLEVNLSLALPRLRLDVRLSVGTETLALVGPSGSGKSSVLRCIAGLVRPGGGRVALGDRVLFDAAEGVDLAPERRHVGLVFQEYALFPHRSVLRNVAYGPRAAGLGRDDAERRAREVLQRFGIHDLADARSGSLSGGERQRVALARAVAAGPEALLLDEPLSALDAVTKSRVGAELGLHLRELGLPSILVSHDVADVLGLADRIAVMEQGRIVQAGTASELLEAPASGFVAAFTGVNYFAGTAVRHGHLTAVRSAQGEATFLSTDAQTGAVGAVVYPWDVAVSDAVPEGSAMNALAGPIRRVAAVGNRVRITLGSTPPVVAEVTEESVRRLGLAPGRQVVATWKATGTRLVPRAQADDGDPDPDSGAAPAGPPASGG